MTPLCELARKYESDKGGEHLRYGGEYCEGTHGYTRAYDMLFAARRFEITSLLEIGVNRGCGLRMWEEYFPHARIIGLDNNDACLFNEGRIECFHADQSDVASLLTAVAHSGIDDFDIIIDDGSHLLPHQLVSLQALHPFVKPGGAYIVEDAYELPNELLAALPPGFTGEVLYTAGVGRWARIEPLIVYNRSK